MIPSKVFVLIVFLLLLMVYVAFRKKYLSSASNKNPALKKKPLSERNVVLAQFSSVDHFDDHQMMLMQSFLAENEIESIYDVFIGGDLVNNYHILVQAKDLERSKELLREYFKGLSR